MLFGVVDGLLSFASYVSGQVRFQLSQSAILLFFYFLMVGLSVVNGFPA
ncbi:hypothetical protein SAMN05421760_1174 [Neptunomonas antarctica]|uniref:Uncharacterized protein n=1 Tax=Neptunomonas antarctica TaxID=619304 RepID=A0A1N7PNC1_9GAMM|nr:hypothetical protein SAMN05421760_1174 [Neptunomonas antarctica]